MKKGDLNFDFVVEVVLFLLTYFTIFTLLPSLSLTTVESEDPFLSESTRLSWDLLEAGDPPDWSNINTINVLGFGYYDTYTHTNVLDFSKVIQLPGTPCPNLYEEIGMTEEIDFKIQVETSSANYSCTNTVGSDYRQLDRVVYIYDGSTYEPAKLSIYAW